MLFCILILAGCYSVTSQEYPLSIRLVGGSGPNEGKVEIFHMGLWGTLCDDNITDTECVVICRHLGYYNGQCVSTDSNVISCLHKQFDGPTPRDIWIDDLKCLGNEVKVDQCHMVMMDHNCLHKEDAGCICDLEPSDSLSTSDNVKSSCEVGRHRIIPFDNKYLGIGIVEIIADVSQGWGRVCDDTWEDIDAKVFCTCLGYDKPDKADFHALLLTKPISYKNIVLNQVHCRYENIGGNLFDCETNGYNMNNSCNAETEVAVVACQALPEESQETVISDLTVECRAEKMNVCYKSHPNSQLIDNFNRIEPFCELQKSKPNSNMACKEINIHNCSPMNFLSNSSHLSYCYKFYFSRQLAVADKSKESYLDKFTLKAPEVILEHSDIVVKTTCCRLKKKNIAHSLLEPIQKTLAGKVFNDLDNDNYSPQFNLSCMPIHENEVSSNSTAILDIEEENIFSHFKLYGGDKIPVNEVANLGDNMKCLMKTNNQIDSKLLMIIQDCSFSPSLNHFHKKEYLYYFIKDKCITENIFKTSFFSPDQSTMGFTFKLPKFEGYDKIVLTCHAFVCDRLWEKKENCDRSCTKIKSDIRQIRGANQQKNSFPKSKINTSFEVDPENLEFKLRKKIRFIKSLDFTKAANKQIKRYADNTISYSIIVKSYNMIGPVIEEDPILGFKVSIKDYRRKRANGGNAYYMKSKTKSNRFNIILLIYLNIIFNWICYF